MKIAIAGRFPPPIDGQSLATLRLADLLAPRADLVRIDTQPAGEAARREAGVTPRRLLGTLRLRARLERSIADHGGTSVALWPSISPDPAGHYRDRLAVLPALRGVPHVVGIVHRGNFDRLFTSPLTRRSARGLVDRVATFVFLTRLLAERCSPWVPDEKRCVIPNTIDDGLLFENDEVAEKQAQRRGRERCRLLFVGNMIAEKGYLDVLEAAAILANRNVAVELVFVGRWMQDRDEAAFLNRVRHLGLESSVAHAGAVTDRSQMKAFYRRSDVLLLPSYYGNEAQPLVVLEAMNAGVPVIATHHGGIPEIVEHGQEGFLVSPRQPEALADAVREALPLERWIRLSTSARRRFESTYAPGSVLPRWLDLLGRLHEASS